MRGGLYPDVAFGSGRPIADGAGVKERMRWVHSPGNGKGKKEYMIIYIRNCDMKKKK